MIFGGVVALVANMSGQTLQVFDTFSFSFVSLLKRFLSTSLEGDRLGHEGDGRGQEEELRRSLAIIRTRGRLLPSCHQM